ncbi:hypothetical protein BDN70DRAFT_865145 [Pholiota conissans]|uniref:Uncharacterized protein n=1 Tax=Pholiota conissans TaxID=109636 RepID=A0A9P6CW14_9AGAR|nr:hypothetical protein BDN70DRAFT_865145 [Pholiota conissans]
MSENLSEVFSTLPVEAQQTLVEKHLLDLLRLIPKESSAQILTTATSLKRKFDEAPKLDLRAKRNEIAMLLDELMRDAKSSFIKERSNREELLSEIVDTLVGWLNPIWSTVYEHRIRFLHAHNCLVFVTDALAQLADNSSIGGCKCSIMNLPIQFSLTDKTGKILKRFSVMGPQNLHRVLLWIWRDLLVSVLAYGTEREKSKMQDFLEDIELALGIRSLGKLVHGGKSGKFLQLISWDEDTGEDSESDYEEEEFGDITDTFGDYSCDDDVDDDDEDEDEESMRCPCSFHAPYWPENVNRERITLRRHLETRLFNVFELTPSLEIYNVLMSFTQSTYQTETRVQEILSRTAGDTPMNLVAALDIHILNGDSVKVAALLESYSYLLRPRDAPTLQCAVTVLYENPKYRARSLSILEKELTECMLAIYGLVRSCFTHIEAEVNKKDMLEILKLHNGSPGRKERVADWTEHVITPSSGALHPMAFAAMMMGLPMMPGTDDGDDADILSYVDLDQDDPELDDLRDSYRPNLKGIFAGWTDIGQTLKGGAGILVKVYLKAVELMPWLRGSDVVSEMTSRLRERPNKNHVFDALSNLSTFAKAQRKKINLTHAELKRRNAAKAGANASTSRASGSPLSPPANPLQSASTQSLLGSPSYSPSHSASNLSSNQPTSSAPSPPSVPHAPPPAPPQPPQPMLAYTYVPLVFGGPPGNPTFMPAHPHHPAPSVDDVD